MKSQLIEILRSPADGSPLRLQVEDWSGQDVWNGSLVDAAGTHFPIRDGVPHFAPEAAGGGTFALKWQRIGSYGHDQPTQRVRRQWYLERFGFEHHADLLAFVRERGLVLDAGAGSGVDTAAFAESGATVVAVDLSGDAAAAIYRHLGHLPNVHVVQADLVRLPFEAATFGFVSCDQVLHHTPDPVATFASLVSRLRADGHLALYVYRRKGPIREFTDDYLRQYTTRMTPEECYEFSRAVTELGKALSEVRAQVTVPVDIPLLQIAAGTEDVQRFFYWNVMKCFWNEEFDFETNIIINYDWYHPRFASRHTPEEVRQWFGDHELSVDVFRVLPPGIAVRGRRRAGREVR